jgi:hypothetical protein
MDLDEITRRQLEQDLVQVGTDAGMVDSRCISNWSYTTCSYEAANGSVHYFDLAPVGSDAVLPAELPL